MSISKTLLLALMLAYVTANAAEAFEPVFVGAAEPLRLALSKTLEPELVIIANATDGVNFDTVESAVKSRPALDGSLSSPGSNSIGVGFSHDSLTNGRGVWNGAYLELQHRFAPRTTIYSSIQQTSKFGLDDTQFMLGGYYPINSITLNVEGTYSGTHHVIAKDSFLASLQFPLSNGWLVTGGVKRSQYNQGPSTQEFGVLEWYYKEFRTALTLSNSQSLGENMVGKRLSLSRYYNDISFITFTVGEGREVDRSVGRKIFLDTRSIGLNGRHWFNPAWAVNWAVTEGKEGRAYNHTGVSLGLRHNF